MLDHYDEETSLFLIDAQTFFRYSSTLVPIQRIKITYVDLLRLGRSGHLVQQKEIYSILIASTAGTT